MKEFQIAEFRLRAHASRVFEKANPLNLKSALCNLESNAAAASILL
jgi:hypothetical protein